MSYRYISDCHFYHANCLRYDNRPWTNVEDETEGMIQLWNKTVAPNDTVYILGDVVWKNKVKLWKSVLDKLNGGKVIVKGNHDPTWILNKLVQDGTILHWSHQEIVDDNGRYLVLNHSPMPFFVNMHHDNTYHLYGHTHISFDYQVIKHVRKQIEELYQHEVRMYNVGCMIRGMDYAPRTLEEIIDIDKTNREFEEGTLEDYLKANVIKGHDKARMA